MKPKPKRPVEFTSRGTHTAKSPIILAPLFRPLIIGLPFAFRPGQIRTRGTFLFRNGLSPSYEQEPPLSRLVSNTPLKSPDSSTLNLSFFLSKQS